VMPEEECYVPECYDEEYVDPEAEEYCYELCYHPWICEEMMLDEDCDEGLDDECYEDCIKNYWKKGD